MASSDKVGCTGLLNMIGKSLNSVRRCIVGIVLYGIALSLYSHFHGEPMSIFRIEKWISFSID